MSQFENHKYWDELALGNSYGVFIDDTGSPGLKDTPPNLHPQRKSWVAVVVSPEQMREVLDQFPGAISELQRLTGATEFHFAEIYARRGPFEHISLPVRLAIFEFMAHIFSIYRFPIFVQTLDPTTLADIRSRGLDQFSEPLTCFDFTRPEDTALFYLLCRLKWFMQQTPTHPGVKARVVVDEGFKKGGFEIKIPTFETVFSDGLVCFASSKDFLPIQLADFAAFALNRTQLIAGKEHRKDIDTRLLQILTPVALNYQNIPLLRVSSDHKGPIIKAAPPRGTN